MRFNVGFGIAILVICEAVAGADEYQPPPMKDGLWETHSVQTVAGKSATDTTVKMCLSQEYTKQSQAFSQQLRKKNECTSTIVQKSGDTVVADTQCAKGMDPGAVNRGIYSHTGDTASHIEMHAHRGGAESVTVMDMKYLGSCPAGMKPGDIVMPDGKVIGGQ